MKTHFFKQSSDLGMDKMLMCVYNEIDNDGRVIRSAEALSSCFPITVLSINSNKEFNNIKFKCKRVGSKGKGLFNLISFWKAILNELKNEDYTHLYLHDYYLTILVFFTSKFKIKHVTYDAHELIIPEPGKSLRCLFFSFLERITINRFSLVVCANKERAHIMHKYYKLATEPLPIRNISVSYDSHIIENARKNKTLDEIRILYQGDVSFERGLKHIVDLHYFLPEKCKIVILGGGPNLEDIKKIVQNLKIHDKIECLGRRPLKDLPTIMAKCDIGIVTYSFKGLNNIYCSPNKVYEYAQAGLPIICTDQPSLKKIIDIYKIGICLSESEFKNPKIFCSKIIELINNKGQFHENLKFFLQNNTVEKEMAKLISVFS